jgi:NhaP-type Na+/H+ or K+/H+ antiporter
MLIALIASLALIVLQHFGVSIGPMAARVLQSVDFDQTLLQEMLSFLLFAGALHINLNDLAKQKWVITILAVVGVLISTFVFGTAGGLRGGISVALALSLPVGSERELVLAMTYMLVVFSILVQGLTIKQVVIWFMRSLSIAVKPRSRS